MTSGETAYLILVLFAFGVFSATVFYVQGIVTPKE